MNWIRVSISLFFHQKIEQFNEEKVIELILHDIPEYSSDHSGHF